MFSVPLLVELKLKKNVSIAEVFPAAGLTEAPLVMFNVPAPWTPIMV